MKIIEIQIIDNNIIFSSNWYLLTGLIGVVVIVALLLNYYLNPNSRFKRFRLAECELKVGNLTTTIKRDYSNIEIAYKIWVEMITRKVALEFDESNDVVVEVYNSWYECFKIIRENIKSVSGPNIENSKEFIDFLVKILNKSLRNHLTRWQARFRTWYADECKKCSSVISPQTIQKQYPEYNELIEDLKKTNKELIELERQLNSFLFEKGSIGNNL